MNAPVSSFAGSEIARDLSKIEKYIRSRYFDCPTLVLNTEIVAQS